jgi:hypothetical protein
MALASKGSQKWLQIAVNRGQQSLLDALRRSGAIGDDGSVEWRSPLERDDFREFRDAAALKQVRVPISDLNTPLEKFWPARGPVWDAIGIVSDNRPIFIEAKAHISEAASPAARATPASLALIKTSLEQARRHYAPRATREWSNVFYQYANRLAYQYFLKKLNGAPSTLVFLYFLNAQDVSGPTSEDEWNGAITLIHAVLGLPKDLRPHGVFDAFLDVKHLPRDLHSARFVMQTACGWSRA